VQAGPGGRRPERKGRSPGRRPVGGSDCLLLDVVVGEMGGFTNCIGIRSALHQALRRRGYDAVKLDPWYFPSDTEYRKVREAGFS
jgi:hypothetical protein